MMVQTVRMEPMVLTELKGLKVLKAVAETMYPEQGSRWPSHEEANVLGEIHDYLAALVPLKRRLITCLLMFVEVGAMPRLPFRRFTRLSLERRERMLNRWDGARIPFLGLCAASLRMLLNLFP